MQFSEARHLPKPCSRRCPKVLNQFDGAVGRCRLLEFVVEAGLLSQSSSFFGTRAAIGRDATIGRVHPSTSAGTSAYIRTFDQVDAFRTKPDLREAEKKIRKCKTSDNWAYPFWLQRRRQIGGTRRFRQQIDVRFTQRPPRTGRGAALFILPPSSC